MLCLAGEKENNLTTRKIHKHLHLYSVLPRIKAHSYLFGSSIKIQRAALFLNATFYGPFVLKCAYKRRKQIKNAG